MKNSILTDRISILFIIFVTLGIYYPTIFAEICSIDDEKMINNLLRMDTYNLKHIFLPNSVHYYRPLIFLTFVFDRFVWLCTESFMHLENVLIHVLNGVLVYLCSKEFFRRFNLKLFEQAPMIIALLFVVHPINTESVCWISGRTDILTATFLYIALFLLLKRGIEDNIYLILSALSYFLALLSKETALGLLLVVFMFLILKGEIVKSKIRKFIVMVPYILITIIYFILRSYTPKKDEGIRIFTGIQQQPEIVSNDLLTLSNIGRCIKATGFYIKKLFFPMPLNFTIFEINRSLYFWLGLLLIAGIIYVVYKRNLYSFLVVITVSFFIPALALVIRNMTWTPLAERYLYISSFGAIILFVISYYRFTESISVNLQNSLLFVLILASCFVTANRVMTWQSNLTIFADTVEKSPRSPAIRNEYGVALAKSGRIEEAVTQFKMSQTLSQFKYKPPLFNLVAINLNKTGDVKKAKQEYINELPTSGRYKYDMLMTIVQLIDREQGEDTNGLHKRELMMEQIYYLQQANKITKKGSNFYKLGQCYLQISDKNMARESFIQAIKIEPKGYFAESAKKLIASLSL
jgi:tetratricopeptide (TPR) repeat protein